MERKENDIGHVNFEVRVKIGRGPFQYIADTQPDRE